MRARPRRGVRPRRHQDHADSGEWDVIVVDCAPTAETIRLLSLPDVLGWYMDRVFPMGRRVNKVVAPGARPGDLAAGGRRRGLLGRPAVLRPPRRRAELLADGERTSVRLVVNPERMVIAEARRTYTYLSLFGYRVDAVVANRLLPDAVDDPWFDRWKAVHAEHLAAIDGGLRPPAGPALGAAAVGADRLRRPGLVRRRPVRRARPHGGAARGAPAAGGEPRRLPAPDPGPPVRVEGRAVARPPRRRADHQRGALPSVDRAPRLAAAAARSPMPASTTASWWWSSREPDRRPGRRRRRQRGRRHRRRRS